MKKVWITTDGRPHDAVLGIFSSEERAMRYRDLLVDRYALGKNMSVLGKPLARDAGAWELGAGPSVAERSIDDNFDFLHGAWVVKVDESCRMVACEFSTQLKARPTADDVPHRHPSHLPGARHDASCRARHRAQGDGHAPGPHADMNHRESGRRIFRSCKNSCR